MRQLGSVVAMAVAIGACSEGPRGKQAASASASAAAAPIGIPGVTVELNRKPQRILSLLAYSRGGSALQITFSTHQLSCNELSGTLRKPGEVAFDMTLAPTVMTDGTEKWAVTRTRLGMMTRKGRLGNAEVSAYDPRETVKAKFSASLSYPANPSIPGDIERHLDVMANIEAKGCGLRPFSADARVRPQRDMKLALANKRIHLTGASLKRRAGKLELLLSSEPHVCGSDGKGSDYTVSIKPDAAGKRAALVRVAGYAVPKVLSQKLEDDTIVVAWSGPIDGTDAVDVELKGLTEIQGYRLSLEGTVKAERCGEPPPG